MNIEFSPQMKRFMQGRACAAKVVEGHQEVQFDSHEQRVTLFWLAAGMLAVAEYGLTSINEPEFMQGLSLGAPAFSEVEYREDTEDGESLVLPGSRT